MEKKTIFKTMMVAACCLGAAVFASCDKDNDNNRSNGLRLSADRITVAPGATASVTVANAAQPLTVKSTDEKTATAKADKNTVTVTGVKEGKASVIVTDKNRQTATVAVTVAKPLAFDKTEDCRRKGSDVRHQVGEGTLYGDGQGQADRHGDSKGCHRHGKGCQEGNDHRQRA